MHVYGSIEATSGQSAYPGQMGHYLSWSLGQIIGSHIICFIFVTRPAKINHLSGNNCHFLSLLYHNLANYLNYCNKVFITTAKFSGLSSAAYGNGMLHSDRKIVAKI